ncbi:MAG: replicative DNA helicase [Gammaproteobacteria bacterium]|nr:replicative DNA helicase [Gammaproteobacteria bacterium]MCW5582443.1 replicative DNA helicase [Gammaproteobacteria bacterium]
MMINSHIAEQAVLGSLLHDNTTFDEIGHVLKINDFFVPFHQDIFRTISILVADGKKADIICVSEILKSEYHEKNDDTFVRICEIAQCCYAPSNIKHYADLVKRSSLDRSLIKMAQDVITSVHEGKENRLDYAQQRFSEVAEQLPSDISPVSDILADVLCSIELRQQNKNNITGVPTGFSDLDALTHGLHGGDLIILAGRPGMGKTLLAMNMAEHIAIKEKHSVAIFSLEMSKQQLVERALISVARLDAEKVQSGTLEAESFIRLSNTIPKLSDVKLFVDDHSSVSITDIRSKCRRIKREHGLSLVVVDYITLMSGDGENETIRIGNISRGLKLLARDLNVPVIAISQLNRSVEQRSDKRPTMADLRQSGAIEQDADLIMFIYRDEVYNKNCPNKGIAEVILAKHRNGNVGTVSLAFNGQYCRFDNYTGGNFGSTTQQSTTWRGRPYVY